MKAIVWDQFGSPATLRDDLPTAAPGSGQVLVRVQASSANPSTASRLNGIVVSL